MVKLHKESNFGLNKEIFLHFYFVPAICLKACLQKDSEKLLRLDVKAVQQDIQPFPTEAEPAACAALFATKA